VRVEADWFRRSFMVKFHANVVWKTANIGGGWGVGDRADQEARDLTEAGWTRDAAIATCAA
jgi:hypothetical protein